MSEQATLARPYAVAAFRHADETGKVAVWSEMLEFLAAVVADPMMRGLVSDPRVGHARLAELIIDVCGGRLSDTGQNFVRVLARAGRLGLAVEISEIFEQQRAAAENRTTVEVTAAYEVNPKFRQTIAEAMQRRTGREVDVTVSIDKSLIGGAVIRAGDVVIDASIRGRLKALAQRMV